VRRASLSTTTQRRDNSDRHEQSDQHDQHDPVVHAVSEFPSMFLASLATIPDSSAHRPEYTPHLSIQF
jgi:hypothetical protein